mmetsp:Transcript_13517/g.28739  ORF Transcript_13517/g.28739 Transcript_13517/m.28739 type:complete len:649 (+) Transcript_13517:149-2095(+)|eukprot:CAMPEP_0178617394 /NCGR_PEP_ID=MMETSP0698-20121128/3697_1 /TAXON_ID=265572 /ORGANISM="Extubocellulus spinifer, Strain CCMP396" /LENGTH=648 /DNA_ID=CAMNT_0020256239 /DNA_START=51 /DNA_END=1997 /DNA_ORIENTATION=+
MKRSVRSASDAAEADSESGLHRRNNAGKTASNAPDISCVIDDSQLGKNTESNDTDEDAAYQITEDTYSFLFTASINSTPFIWALFIFVFQSAILVIIEIGMVEDGSPDNKLSVPSGVTRAVRVSQFIALILAPFTQDDFISSLDMFTVRYDKSIVKEFPAASHPKWFLANTLRGLQGCLYLGVCFCLIVQASDTLTVFLNFAALNFVGELDDVALILARKGYLGHKLEIEGKKLGDVKTLERQAVSIGPKCKVPARLLRSMVLLLALGGLITGGAIIASNQNNGQYLCNSVTVLFGDEVWETEEDVDYLFYAYFSGRYEIKKGLLENQRPVYFERGRDPTIDPSRPPGKFSYCASEKAWVFTIDGITKGDQDDGDCTTAWLLRSPKTTAFDLSEVSSDGWAVWTGIVNPPPTEFFSISCDECSSEADCNYHGSCSVNTKQCECDDGWIGTSCVLDEPCEVIVDEYYEYQFSLLRDDNDGHLVMVYDRPVYFAEDAFSDGTIVVIYTGRRWYDVYAEISIEDFILMFNDFFHGYWNAIFEFSTDYFSEPTGKSSPVGLEMNQLISFAGDFGAYGDTVKTDRSFHCMEGTCDRCDYDVGGTRECIKNQCICDSGCGEDGYFYNFTGYFCHIYAPSDTICSSSGLNGEEQV